MYKHVTWQHLNQYMTSNYRGHCDNIKVFNQGKSNQIREKSGKNQGIWLLKMCGHPASGSWAQGQGHCVYFQKNFVIPLEPTFINGFYFTQILGMTISQASLTFRVLEVKVTVAVFRKTLSSLSCLHLLMDSNITSHKCWVWQYLEQVWLSGSWR